MTPASEENPRSDPIAEFVPPYPLRPHARRSIMELIGSARRDLLSIWTLPAFSRPFDHINVLRRQIVICNSPQTVQETFVRKHPIYQRKTPQIRHALAPLIGDGLFISDGDTWQRRRRIVAPIIHSSRLAQFAPVMIETACEQREAWRKLGPAAEVDALDEMAHLTAEIICRTIFGRQLGRAHTSEVVESFSEYQRHIDQIDLPSLLGLPEWFPRRRGREVRKSVRRIHKVLDDIIDSYTADGEASVIGGLLEARDENGAPLDRDAIRAEASVIFMAGHETTANTLAWAWYLLSQSPNVRATLSNELDTVLGGRTPGLEDVALLPYTRAVIEETLRLYPPVPILAREANQADKLNGLDLRKGALVLVVPWLLHRNPRLWSDPDHFRPERFLPGGDGAQQSKYGYIPFGIGPRICAGLTFGLNESILCLAVLAQSFDLKLAEGEIVEPQCRLTLRPGNRLRMVIHPRSGAGQRAHPPAANA